AERRPGLYHAIRSLNHVMVMSRVSPCLAFCMTDTARVYSVECNIFAFARFGPFAVLQCRLHETWARFFASTLEERLRYTPSDCFETFSFPPDFDNATDLDCTGSRYHEHRSMLMIARNEGMTKTYNRFHDPTESADDIQRLRELHAAMDRAVLEAYGWRD